VQRTEDLSTCALFVALVGNPQRVVTQRRDGVYRDACGLVNGDDALEQHPDDLTRRDLTVAESTKQFERTNVRQLVRWGVRIVPHHGLRVRAGQRRQ